MSTSPKHCCKNIGCNEKFKWPMQLNRHKKVCSKQPPDIKYTKLSDGTFKCNVCAKVFQFQSGVSKHLSLNTCNAKKEDHSCPTCGKTFAFKCRLVEHMKTHSVEKVCPKCARKFKRPDFFQMHVVACNKEDKVCLTRNKTFKRLDHFEKHVLKCSSVEESESSSLEVESGADQMYENNPSSYSMAVNWNDSSNLDASVTNEPLEGDIHFAINEGCNELDFLNSTAEVPAESFDFGGSDLPESEYVEPDEVRNSTFLPLEAPYAPDDVYNSSFPVLEISNTPEENLSSHNATASSEARSEYYKDYRIRKRKTNRLEAIVKDLSSPVKAKVVKDFMRGTPRVLTEIYSYTECTNRFEALAIASIISRLKTLSKEKKYGTFYKLLDEFFGENLQDDGFAHWLIWKKLGIRTNRCLPRLAMWKERGFQDSRGRSRLPPEVVQKVFDVYVENSITSTDGRNGRNMVKIKKRRLLEIYGSILTHDDIKLEEKVSRKRTYFQSNRRILTCTIREIQEKLEGEGLNVCHGKLLELKPFFIAYPTDKELALCLCKLCLNARLLLDPLRTQAKKDGDEISDSVTEFFMDTCSCDKGENGYYQWTCVQGKCKNCKHNKPTYLKCSTSEEQVQVSQFETTKTPYTHEDKTTGEKTEKISKQTERVVSMRSFTEIYKSLSELRTKYLMHRYQVFNDKYQWPQILATTDTLGPIYHFDYSENLTQSYKYEPQSSHFNKKQYSLHCTVKHFLDSSQYFYHFSDSKKHDFAYTSHVLNHLLDLEEEDNVSVIIRVKSDNCSCQYKCCYVFKFYHNLAKKLGKTIIVYYGVCGHGKGLVDAMSAFGVKSPLRRAVVTENFKYNSADEIRSYLSIKFSKEFPEKQYYTVDPATLDGIRKDKESLKIKDCQAQHMISYFPDGQVQTKVNICSCNDCLEGQFIKCTVEAGRVVQQSEEGSEDESDEAEYENEDIITEELAESVVRGDSVLNAIAKGNIIALLTDTHEPFYLCKVLDFGVATKELGDQERNNFATVGEQFIACQYLDVDKKRKKTRGMVHYKLLDAVVYIYPATVFVPCVNIGSDLSLSAEEFQWLCDCN